MNFVVNICEVGNVAPALFGIGLSYGLTSNITYADFPEHKNRGLWDKLKKVADALAHKQGGHNKFLETITLTLDITAPRYWWAQFDTYRVGVTKQSESTMHTIMNRELTYNDFVEPSFIDETVLDALNHCIRVCQKTDDAAMKENYFREIKNLLPEGYLQRRIVLINIKTLQNIYSQRKNHRLREWQVFFNELAAELKHSTYWGFELIDWIGIDEDADTR